MPKTKVIMKADMYTDILGTTLLPFIQDVYPDSHKFMQDNDPKHTSRHARQWIGSAKVNCFFCLLAFYRVVPVCTRSTVQCGEWYDGDQCEYKCSNANVRSGSGKVIICFVCLLAFYIVVPVCQAYCSKPLQTFPHCTNRLGIAQIEPLLNLLVLSQAVKVDP